MAAGDSPNFEGVFYTRIDKKSLVYQPSYTRVRHRYRGHRESHKVNLEMSQMYAELARIDIDLSSVEDNFENHIENILTGINYSDIYFTDQDATPTNEAVAITGLNDFMGKLQALEQRIARLEDV